MFMQELWLSYTLGSWLTLMSATGVTYHKTSEAVIATGATKLMCAPAGTPVESSVSSRLRKQFLIKNRVTEAQIRELHLVYLVPISMGGAPNIDNVILLGRTEHKQKSELEIMLLKLICTGRMSYKSAERQLRMSWRSAYNRYVMMKNSDSSRSQGLPPPAPPGARVPINGDGFCPAPFIKGGGDGKYYEESHPKYNQVLAYNCFSTIKQAIRAGYMRARR